MELEQTEHRGYSVASSKGNTSISILCFTSVLVLDVEGKERTLFITFLQTLLLPSPYTQEMLRLICSQ